MNKKILPFIFIAFLLLAPALAQAGPNGPYLHFSTDGNDVTVTWPPLEGVEGEVNYTIEFGPADQPGFQFEDDLGPMREDTFTVTSPEGFKVAVSARDKDGNLLAVSSLEKVKVPKGKVKGRFFMNVEYSLGTIWGVPAKSSGAVIAALYTTPENPGVYTVYGKGDFDDVWYGYWLECPAQWKTMGQLTVTGTLHQGLLNLIMTSEYPLPMTSDDSCSGVDAPDFPPLDTWEVKIVNLPLKRGSVFTYPPSQGFEYEVQIWDAFLENCPECQAD